MLAIAFIKKYSRKMEEIKINTTENHQYYWNCFSITEIQMILIKTISAIWSQVIHGFQFGFNNWDAQLASVTCFQVLETRNQVTQDQIINVKF